MIHSAKFGSIERFFGVLVEHYAGAFPPWLAPVQVRGIPIAERYDDYLAEVAAQLRAAGVRVEVDDSDDRMQKKIRNAQPQKVPFMLIAGDDDVGRRRGVLPLPRRHQDNGVPVDEALAARHRGRAPSRARSDPVVDETRTTRTAPGVPDELERLWTPHRMAYIRGREQAVGRLVGGVPVLPVPAPATTTRASSCARARRRTWCSTSTPTTPGTCWSAPTATSPTTPSSTEDETAEVAHLTQTRCG